MHAMPITVDEGLPGLFHVGTQMTEIDEVVVIEAPGPLSADHGHLLRRALESAFPNRRVVVLDSGMRVSGDRQLRRIEETLHEQGKVIKMLTQQVATLVQALAESFESKHAQDPHSS
jgi:hypothetical protein